ncbi:Type VI secretion protein Fha1 [Candidatus Methylobacter favarea]|uniref:Type VI secretion protein Fha1 n=1 Tax=Candidatus Methylobacter favarea TaxID=2707345 RepID=A0A8S0Y963_9GAMM|nr:type VI secretion system-associated FHA domain protein TagH [Candidatus Methylobacter favarea]CAA9889686.1 Type VI secretion protein Fha1 [Candidatus Methylobacter favarea]
MKLSLIVISCSGVALDRALSITLNQKGATLGRREDNTLVLPDPRNYISGHHAVIEYKYPNYYITDTSTNGVLINQTKMLRGQGNSVKLNDGDNLKMGDYSLLVKIIEENRGKADLHPVDALSENLINLPEDPFAEINSDPIQEMIDKNDLFPSDWKSHPETSENPLDLPDNQFPKPSSNEQDDLVRGDLNRLPAHKEAFQPFEKKIADQANPENQLESPSDIFSDDWYLKSRNKKNEDSEPSAFLKTEPLLPQKSETKNRRRKTQSVTTDRTDTSPHELTKRTVTEFQHELIQNFLRGAQLDESKFAESLDPETFYIIGKMLRASVQGTMDVLLGRAKIKNEMHLDVTLIRPRQNNPFKFSVSADEALTKLLSPQNTGYLPPDEAIKEAFDDIKAHQYSVIAGMQTALLAVLHRFDPKKLEQRLQEQTPLSANVPILKQVKLWALFEHMYEEIEHEAEDNFYNLFGQAFAETYEQQIQKLKTSKKDI